MGTLDRNNLNHTRVSINETSDEKLLKSKKGNLGEWTEIVPFSDIDCNWITFLVYEPSKKTSYSIDIGIGEEGSEEILFEGLLYHVSSDNNIVSQIPTLKVELPIGSRMVARASTPRGRGTVKIKVISQGT